MKLTRGLIAKRRAIALDVIAQVKAKRFQAESGTYLRFEAAATATGKELQKVLPKLVSKKKPCQVCAIGSIFLSSVCKFDQFKLTNETVHSAEPSGIGYSAMRDKVSEFFDEREQAAIERAFETSGEGPYFRFLDCMNDGDRLLWLMAAVAQLAGDEITEESLRHRALISIATDPEFEEIRYTLDLI